MPCMTLPTALEIGGKEYEIRSDYRAAIDTQIAQADFDITDRERAVITLCILIPDAEKIPNCDLKEALEKCVWYLSCGRPSRENGKSRNLRLMDWEQDFNLIVTAVNKIAGYDVRGVDYLHWWTFMSYYCEIDSKCLFAQVVQMRKKIAMHKKLDKSDREFYKANIDLIEFERKYSEKDKEFFRKMGV